MKGLNPLEAILDEFREVLDPFRYGNQTLLDRQARKLNSDPRYRFEGLSSEDLEVEEREAEGLAYLLESKSGEVTVEGEEQASIYSGDDAVVLLDEHIGSQDGKGMEELQRYVGELHSGGREAGFVAMYDGPGRDQVMAVNLLPQDQDTFDIYIDPDWDGSRDV